MNAFAWSSLLLAWSLSVDLTAGPPDSTAGEPPLAPTLVEPVAPPLTIPPPPRIDMAQIDAVLAGLPPAPSLQATQDAALWRAGVDSAAAIRWLRRARVAAALPTLSVQYDHRLDRGWALDQEVGEADALRNDAGNQAVVRARATWELDRLIYAPDELRAARAAIDTADLRARVLVEVTSLYFERQRLLVERELAPPADLDAANAAALRLREVEGLLAGLTGLEFATNVAR
jgi:hypothetical protein